MASKYSQYSPYAKVGQTWHLDYNLPMPILPSDSDVEYTIPAKYDERPDRLAKELFNNERLMYIFALCNPDILIDPIYDFKAGVVIKIPTIQRIQQYLTGSRSVK